ncbi:MAG: Bug family tripartite tricarboxylate transporter substrate binding protein [Burkholderiales bacterium]
MHNPSLAAGNSTPSKISAAFLALAVACATFASNTTADAQDYPNRPVRVIAPFAPGGQIDTVARIVAARLTPALGKQFVVDNRPGAGGSLGADLAAKANPDGYTLIMVSPSFAINPSLSKHTPYDPRRHFQPVYLVASAPNVLLVHPSLPVRTVKELVGFAKSRPGQIAYASSGIGTPPHLAGELFSSLTGLKLLHVPYKGGGPATADLMAGQVSLMFLGMAPSLPLVKAGRVRAIGTTGSRRATGLPDVPTVAESGYPSFDIVNWIGLLAPAGTPRPVIDRLHAELSKTLATGKGREQLAALGLDAAALKPEEFSRFLEAEIDRWAAVVKLANASAK